MMQAVRPKIAILAVATALALVLPVDLEGVDVRVEHDKTFDFKPIRTWAWNPEGPGDMRMARTPDDDPDAMKRKAEPVILDAVATETMRRGLQLATSQPDLTLNYFLLLSTSATGLSFTFVTLIVNVCVPTLPSLEVPCTVIVWLVAVS